MNVPIQSSITECVFETISFSSSSIVKSYAFGDVSFSEYIPSIVSSPNCGYSPVIESQVVTPNDLPEGINWNEYITVDFATGEIKVLESMNLLLKDKSISISIPYTA